MTPAETHGLDSYARQARRISPESWREEYRHREPCNRMLRIVHQLVQTNESTIRQAWNAHFGR